MLLTTVAVGAGCASSPETVVLDWRGSDAGLAMAQAAADEWWTVCHAVVIVARDNGGAPLEEVAGNAGADGRKGETTVTNGKVLSVTIGLPARDERAMLAHEFGHALGIVGHSATGVMALVVKPGSQVAPADCP